jgi:hypothetical protein
VRFSIRGGTSIWWCFCAVFDSGVLHSDGVSIAVLDSVVVLHSVVVLCSSRFGGGSSIRWCFCAVFDSGGPRFGGGSVQFSIGGPRFGWVVSVQFSDSGVLDLVGVCVQFSIRSGPTFGGVVSLQFSISGGSLHCRWCFCAVLDSGGGSSIKWCFCAVLD